MNIYIHIPLCESKCPYCAFYSCINSQNISARLFNSLKEEIITMSGEYSEPVKTIYIGGGTPNLVPSKYITETISQIKEHFTVLEDAEISIELYPNYITKELIDEYIKVGVNRVSIGLQSTDNQDLKTLGRRYTYQQFLEKYKIVKDSSINNIGIDLIFGYPTHTLEKWKESLELISNLDIKHISAYSLEIEPNSVYGELFKENKLNLPEEEIDREMYYLTSEILNKRGFKQYEISNYSKEGYECKHNLNFWNYDNYLGLGAGAYSRIGNKKFNNPEDIDMYINNNKKIIEYITEEDMFKESIILGLRKNSGVAFNERYYLKEYMDRDKDSMFLNKRGRDMFNRVIENLMKI